MDMDPDHWDRDIREAFLTALTDHLIEAAVTIQAVPVPEPDAAKPAVARAARAGAGYPQAARGAGARVGTISPRAESPTPAAATFPQGWEGW